MDKKSLIHENLSAAIMTELANNLETHMEERRLENVKVRSWSVLFLLIFILFYLFIFIFYYYCYYF